MCTHHRGNQHRRGKYTQLTNILSGGLLFGCKTVGVTLHTTVLGLFSKRVMLLLCCFNPIKKGSGTLIYCYVLFYYEPWLVRGSHYRKTPLSWRGRWCPGCGRACACSLAFAEQLGEAVWGWEHCEQGRSVLGHLHLSSPPITRYYTHRRVKTLPLPLFSLSYHIDALVATCKKLP